MRGRISSETFHTPICRELGCGWIGDATSDQGDARRQLDLHHRDHPVTVVLRKGEVKTGGFDPGVVTALRCGRCAGNPIILTYDARGQKQGETMDPERVRWPDGRPARTGEEVMCPTCGLGAFTTIVRE